MKPKPAATLKEKEKSVDALSDIYGIWCSDQENKKK